MAELLFKKGSFKILSDNVAKLSPEEMNILIKTAGTTCYQARETSKKMPAEFIQMVWKRGHRSVLEHSWFCFLIRTNHDPRVPVIVYDLHKANSLFCITDRPGGFLLISGNARMFNEAYEKTMNPVVGRILDSLNKKNPILFPAPKMGFRIDFSIRIIPNPDLVTKKEVLIHRAMTVEFNNHSRGFTHEDVRSRNGDQKIASYSQESTRYVDYAKGEENLDQFQMKFILPYKKNWDFEKSISFSVDGHDYCLTSQQFTNLMEAWYRALRKEGLKPEEARQWLPIGVKAQIVQTYNLNEWRHWFQLRAGRYAHPEIRFSALKLLKKVKKRIPGIFDDFVFYSEKKEKWAEIPGYYTKKKAYI